jgi:hypothetical protein
MKSIALSIISAFMITVLIFSNAPPIDKNVLMMPTGISIPIQQQHEMYSKPIVDYRLLLDLGDDNYLVEISVNTRVENIARPGRYIQIKIPHLVKMTIDEIKQLYETSNK